MSIPNLEGYKKFTQKNFGRNKKFTMENLESENLNEIMKNKIISGSEMLQGYHLYLVPIFSSTGGGQFLMNLLIEK